tara:strand:+ start:978 stop:1835 length:858 start_codon:yes stop_codon:yes gene_type:complete
MGQITTPFLSGFLVKPSSISSLGRVTYTDGTNTFNPNQLQCEAYGYTYDKVSNTCSAFRYNTNLNSAVANENNKTFGSNNSTQTGTNNTLVMGESNTVRGFSRNSSIIGNNNVIDNGVNNASVSGTLGEATASGSVVLGGNTSGDILGERQSVKCIYGVQTTSNSTLASGISNVAGSRFVIPDNTAVYFHADTLAVRVGGTYGSGALGDYGSWVERGVIINKSGVLSIQRERDTIKTSGYVNNWRILAAVGSGDTLSFTCRGHTDVIIEWCMNVNITQIKTGVTL